MKDSRLVLEPAKGALIVCALSMMLALVIGIGLAKYHTAKEGLFAQREGGLQGTRSEIETLTTDLASLDAHLTTFTHLSGIGLIGDPERDLWVQNLEAIYNGLGLPPTLRYTLAPPQPLVDPQDAASGEIPPAAANALRHDLAIELSGIHDEEFLGFIKRLRTDWQTPFRIESCQMSREAETGLQIKCVLRLFSLPQASDGQPAGG